MSNLENALRELRQKRRHAQIEIDRLDQIIAGIESWSGTKAAGPSKTTPQKRIISIASRRKMALAQKARWASIRKNSHSATEVTAISAPRKRDVGVSS